MPDDMPDLRPVGHVIGLLSLTLGLMMLLPAAIDLARGAPGWQGFAQSAMLTMSAGGALALACASATGQGLDLRQSFVLTSGVWLVLPAFGALPLMLGPTRLGLTDAMFESMSGLTTTGATVLAGLDHLPHGVALWRGMLQWLGGLGIVIVALIFLPVMKVGGMQFFRAEGFDTLGKVLPRARGISIALVQIYAGMTFACMLGFMWSGMSQTDAVIQALATVSTGGFSNRDTSFSHFGPWAEAVAIVFMILATLPFIRFIQGLRGEFAPLWHDAQVRAYLLWTFGAIALVAAWRMPGADRPLLVLRESAFNVVSIFSGTGFTMGDPGAWAPLPFMVLLVVGLVGGCTSSTGCSVKVFRYLVVFSVIRARLQQLATPRAISPPRLDGRPLDDEVIRSVIVFMALFVATYAAVAVALSISGLQAATAMIAAWTAVANIGPAWGSEVGPTGALGAFPPMAKWVMIIGMMLGRLEVLSVLVLFTARFWRGP